ncbi:hypothetical protein [Streptomyces sp. NPDC051636]|uniref:hypothetical protein n=1 Tax=Streptomyces sp. NPDC051636 TaxID=3365663 RepID=UPI0037A78820
MRRLSDTLHRDLIVRTVLGSAPEGAAVLASLAEEVRSLGLALTQRFAWHRDDPAFDFSTYFGERSVVEGPVDLDSPLVASSGSSVAVRAEAVAGRSGTVNLGIVPFHTIRAQVRPVLRRVEVAAGESARAEFTVDVEPDAVPQLYSLLPYAVHDLGIAVGRVYFTVVRPDDTSGPDGEVSAR